MVLAAGLGSRLRHVHGDRPKGFVEIGGEPIIARSLRLLRAAGVKEIVFVLGWKAEVYRHWLTDQPGILGCVDNPDYATTGSLRSLLLGAAHVPGRDLIVVESDLIYERRATDLLLAARSSDAVLVSGFTQSGDEVWVCERAPAQLGHLSKQRASDREPVGELVGLSRLSAGLVDAIRAAAQALPAAAHYEDGLNAVASVRSIPLLHVTDLLWAEIDDPAHLARVQHAVWPRIHRAEKSPAPSA